MTQPVAAAAAAMAGLCLLNTKTAGSVRLDWDVFILSARTNTRAQREELIAKTPFNKEISARFLFDKPC